MDAEWEKLPMYIGCKEIVQLGFKKTSVYRWFKSDDFPPMVRQSGLRVNKYKFKEWLENSEVCKCDI